MEIYTNLSEKITLLNIVSGELVDLPSLPSVGIYYNDVVLYSPTVTKVPDSVGIYEATTQPHPVEIDIRAKWSTGHVQDISIVTPYINVSDLYRNIESGRSWSEVKKAESWARHKINNATLQKFGKSLDQVSEQGDGTDVLPLRKRIVEIESISQNGILVYDPEDDINKLGFGVGITASNSAIYLNKNDPKEYAQTSIMHRGGGFVEDYTYLVEGYFGWESVPEDIVLCAQELFNDYFCNDSTWKKSYVDSIKAEGFSVKLNPRVFNGTGNSFVDNILSQYVWTNWVVV